MNNILEKKELIKITGGKKVAAWKSVLFGLDAPYIDSQTDYVVSYGKGFLDQF